MAKKKSVDDVVEVEAEVEADKETAEVAPYKIQKKDEGTAATTSKSSKTGILLTIAGVTIAVAAAVILFNKSGLSLMATANTDDTQETVAVEGVTTTDTVTEKQVTALVTGATADKKVVAVSEVTQPAATGYAPFKAPAPYAYAQSPYGYTVPPQQQSFNDMMKRQQETMQRERQRHNEMVQNRLKFEETLLKDVEKRRHNRFSNASEWRVDMDKRYEEAKKRHMDRVKKNRAEFEKMRQGI